MDLLILDDFGLQPFDATARMNLLDVIEDRYGKKKAQQMIDDILNHPDFFGRSSEKKLGYENNTIKLRN